MTKIGKKLIYFHYKIIHEFPSGEEAGPNGLVHRKVEDLIYNKVNGQDNLFEVKFDLKKTYFLV